MSSTPPRGSEPDETNPFEAPTGAAGPRRSRARRRPPVLYIYAAYCWGIALVAGLISLSAAVEAIATWPDDQGAGLGAIAFLVASIAFAAGPLLPRRPWAWTYGILLILVGFAISWVFIALWVSPRTKHYFLEPGA